MALLKVNVVRNCATAEAKAWLFSVMRDLLHEVPKNRLETRVGKSVTETALWELEGAVRRLEPEAVDRIFEDAKKKLPAERKWSMTSEEARRKVRGRCAVVRQSRNVAQGELRVLEALYEALLVGGFENDNVTIILDMLQEDE